MRLFFRCFSYRCWRTRAQQHEHSPYSTHTTQTEEPPPQAVGAAASGVVRSGDKSTGRSACTRPSRRAVVGPGAPLPANDTALAAPAGSSAAGVPGWPRAPSMTRMEETGCTSLTVLVRNASRLQSTARGGKWRGKREALVGLQRRNVRNGRNQLLSRADHAQVTRDCAAQKPHAERCVSRWNGIQCIG